MLALVAACMVLGYAAAGPLEPPGTPGEAKVVFPPDRAVILTGTFQVIAKGLDGELKVDGQARPWEPFASPLKVAKVGVLPGVHEIQIGDRKIPFVVGLSAEEHEGPRQWPVVRSHSIKVDERRCGDCHETSQTEGKLAVGQLRGAKACFECHKAPDFEVIHSRPLEPEARCQKCHALHGSSRKSLLKPSVKRPQRAEQ